MPFFDIKPLPQNLGNVAPDDTPEVDPSLLDTFGAAFRTQNIVGSYLTSRGQPNPYEIEDGFDAIDYVKDDPEFSPYVEEFAGVFNKRSADALKLQIKREEADRRTLDAAGATGVVAQMAAGVLDLPTLIPIGGPLVGGAKGIGGTALRLGLAAGIDAGVSEAALQATQATRTADETALNVGGSVVLGGALGALVGRYLSNADVIALSRKIEGQEAGFEAADGAFARAGSAGAAARDRGPLELKDEALISKLPIVNRQDPMIRLQLGELETGRDVVRKMAETPLEYADNAKGVATELGGSVETRMKMWNGPLAKSLREIDTEYARYFNATPEPSSWQVRLSPLRSEFARMTGGQKLTYKQFKEEVGRATYMGGQHEIPEVAAAAKHYREIDETLKKAAIEAGLFPEDVAVAGDISHRFRMYNKQKIIANRGVFRTILSDFFEGQQAAALKAEAAKADKRNLGLNAERNELELGILRRGESAKARESGDEINLDGLDEDDVIGIVRRINSGEKPKQPESLSQWLRRQKNGFSDPNGELAAVYPELRKMPGKLRASGGDSLDDVVLRAWEEGFFNEGAMVRAGLNHTGERPTIREFLDALDADLRGTRVVREADMMAAKAADDFDEVMRALDRMGVDLERPKFGTSNAMKDLAARVNRVLDDLDRQRIDKLNEKANAGPEHVELSKQEIDALADEVIDTILGNAEGRIPYDIVAGPRGPLKDRLLKIETAKIHDFVENDIESVLRAQMRTMSADVELAKKFGSVDLKEEIRKVNDEANDKIAKATEPKQRERLEKARKDTVRDIEGIRDRLRGTYRLPADPSSLVLRAGRVARNLNYLRLLGGMTISAIPDMAKVVFTHGLMSTFRDGFIPMVRNFKAFRVAAEEVKMAGTALDMILDSRTMAMADIVDEFGHHSKFERGLHALTSKYGVVSLMAPWNAAMKQFAGMVTMTSVLKAAERVAKGTASADDIRKLAASGIDEDMALRIWKQFAGGEEMVAPTSAADAPRVDESPRLHVRKDGSLTFEPAQQPTSPVTAAPKMVKVAGHGTIEDGIYMPGGANWTDKKALEAFRAAVVRDVDRIIVTPGQDKPLWMSTELGKTVGQFKSFAVSSMQKTMLAGLQQRDAATLNGTLLMLGLGAMTYWAKQTAAGQPVSDDPAVWAVEAFDKSGVSGWLMEANNIAEKASRGRVGLSALTGKQVSRYASRNVTGAFLGPTPEAISDIFQVSGSIFAGDTTKSDLRRVRQMIPFQNLFFLRQLFNQVEDATGTALDLPETRN